MSVSLGPNDQVVWIPSYDPVLEEVVYQQDFKQLLTDNVSLLDNGFDEAVPQALGSLIDCRWLSQGYTGNSPAVPLSEGLNTIPAMYPVGIKLTLMNENTAINDWYGNPDFKKLGFVRRTMGGGKETQMWINALVQEMHWDADAFDGLEVFLSTGVTGQAVIAPWLGCPPSYQSYNEGPITQLTPPFYYIGPTITPPNQIGVA